MAKAAEPATPRSTDLGSTLAPTSPSGTWTSPSPARRRLESADESLCAEDTHTDGFGDTRLPGGHSGAQSVASSPSRYIVPAYYDHRKNPRAAVTSSVADFHLSRQPALAATLHAAELWHHQSLPRRRGPHPVEGAQQRWPSRDLYNRGLPPDPLDCRRTANSFPSRSARWKAQGAADKHQQQDVPQLTMEDIKLFLTSRFGSVRTAFTRLDFFQDGTLSKTEFQEGLYNLFANTTGEKYAQYRCAVKPRWAFNERMSKLFQTLDKDQDGLISFEDFTASGIQPTESSHQFTRRRVCDNVIGKGEVELQRLKSIDTLGRQKWKEVEFLLRPDTSCKTEASEEASPAKENDDLPPVSFADEPRPKSSHAQLLEDFATVLLRKYKNIQTAFEAIDISGNGKLSKSEFIAGCDALHFNGDVGKIFHDMDTSCTGVITMKEFKVIRRIGRSDGEFDGDVVQKTRKQLVEERRQRDRFPVSPLNRGDCLSSLHVQRPLGEHVTTSSGFYSFQRSPTGRMDRLRHPYYTPGDDLETFSLERGPGFFNKGPEYFSESGCAGHPVRGSKWKVGANMGKSRRMGPLIPTAEDDKVCSEARFANYEGHAAPDTWRVNNVGALGMAAKQVRTGPTLATEAGFTTTPKPLGTWAITRMGKEMMSRSSPSLLRHVC